MFKILKNAWAVPDLRKKILLVLALILVFRFGSYIPVPGIDRTQLHLLWFNKPGIGGLFNIISGGALSQISIFAMSITPYINASIIIQLLTIAIPSLEAMAKEGEEGRKKLAQYTRYFTIVLALIQSIGLAISFSQAFDKSSNIWLTYIIVVMSLTAGTAFIMWLGEQMTEYGIGNGTSLIIFAGILAGIPSAITGLDSSLAFTSTFWGKVGLAAVIVGILLIVAAVVWMQEAERRIPVQYAKRVVGRKMYGGQSTHIPIKVSMAGVIPIILAMSLMMFPALIVQLTQTTSEFWLGIANICSPQALSPWWVYVIHCVIYSLLIIGFSFFYTVIVFNPVEVANTLKKNGGFIPGIRAGKPTADYINGVLNKVTLFGAIFIAAIAIIPVIVQAVTGISLGFGGTTVLIVVGVALETTKQLESQLVMKHYKGFLD